jgi:hypothetical protein
MLAQPLWNRSFTPASGDPHIVSFYVGLPLLGLAAWAALGPDRRLWRPVAAMSALGLVLSLGSHLPFHGAVLGRVAVAGLFRFPAQILCLPAAGLPLLAGAGLSRLPRPWMAALLGALAALDLWAFDQKAIKTVDAAVYGARPATAAFLENAPAGRVLTAPKTRASNRWGGRDEAEAWGAFKDALVPNVGMAWGLSDADGFEQVRGRDYERVLAEAGKAPDSPWLDWMAVRYVTSRDPLPAGRWKPVFRSSVILYENAEALPRAYLAPRALALPREEVFAALSAGTHAPGSVVLVEGPLAAGEQAGAAGTVRWKEEGPNGMSFEVDAAGPAWLVVTDAWAPGWRARADGKPIALRRANFCQRAVRLPAGASSVEMRYAPPLWGPAWALSFLGAAVLWMGDRRWKRNRP